MIFDYVNLRVVFTCFNNPKKVIRNAFENINPGGWLEFQDGTMKTFQAKPEFRVSYFTKFPPFFFLNTSTLIQTRHGFAEVVGRRCCEGAGSPTCEEVQTMARDRM
jgi:hypothetical protein